MKKIKFILLFGIIFFILSCATEHYKKPDIPLPATEKNVKFKNLKWWELFNDKTLKQLISTALKNNDNLKMAFLKIKEAEAGVNLSVANEYPIITGNIKTERSKLSKEYYSYKMLKNNLFINGKVSYEVDLWQKLRSRTKASISKLLSVKAIANVLKLEIISETVYTYLNIVAVNNELLIVKNILKNYFDIYKYREKQYKHGIIDEFTLEQARAEYLSIKSSIDSLNEDRVALESKLSLLTGETPRNTFNKKYKIRRIFNYNLKIIGFIPSEILNKRPDIKAAEENLKAANFNVAAAKAAFFPEINLTAAGGLQSNSLSSLLNFSASTWSIAGNLFQSIFDFGRIKSNVKIMKTERREAAINYVKTVKKAFNEIYDYLNRIKYCENKIKKQINYLSSLNKLLVLANKKFNVGTTEYLSVLDAQRRMLQANLNLIKYKIELMKYKILFYKALGIGLDY